MRLTIDAAGEARHVQLQRAGAGFAARVDGRTLAVDVAQAADGWSLLIGEPARSYDVSIVEHGAGAYSVYVNGREIRAQAASARPAGAMRDTTRGDGAGTQQILAPMPGRIVKVLVRPGDAVTAGQGVVVVEAMKMENELRAPRPGTVTAVHVTEGMSVDARAVLVVIGQDAQ